MTVVEYRAAACDAVAGLSADVGIPADLKGIARGRVYRFPVAVGYGRRCSPGNPKEPTQENIAAIYRSLLQFKEKVGR